MSSTQINAFFLFLFLQLIEAGLRELEEETGLHILPSQCIDQQVDILALWEVCKKLYCLQGSLWLW